MTCLSLLYQLIRLYRLLHLDMYHLTFVYSVLQHTLYLYLLSIVHTMLYSLYMSTSKIYHFHKHLKLLIPKLFLFHLIANADNLAGVRIAQAAVYFIQRAQIVHNRIRIEVFSPFLLGAKRLQTLVI